MTATSSTDRSFFGHPRGLSTLFFTEMWERFSYYGMRALLLLYMTAPLSGRGLGFDAAQGGAIYGLYTSMVYLATLPGGWIADRLIGQRRAVLYGGIVIAAGHFSMAAPALAMFYLGLVLIVIGTGLLKGNVSVMVGKLYAEGDIRRDAGFSIFYMGINLGAFIAPLICGYLGTADQLAFGFAAAGVGMTLGVVQYVLGSSNLGDAGLSARARQPERAVPLAAQGSPAGCSRRCAWFGGRRLHRGDSSVRDAGRGCCRRVPAVVICWFLRLAVPVSDWTPEERKRLYVIGVLFLAASLFWSVFEQAGSTLNLFADRNTVQQRARVRFPEQLVPVDELVVPDPLCAGDGVGVGPTRGRRQGTVDADEVCVGAGVRRPRLRDSRDSARPWDCSPVRCGLPPRISCTR